MRETTRSISPLLMGMALLMLGNGALPTLMAVRLSAGGEPTWLIGLVMAQYYLGIILGTLYGYKLIMTVGHIRTFAALGSTMSAVTLAHAFISDPWAWAVFRFIVGACAVGMYMCVESWLNARADITVAGRCSRCTSSPSICFRVSGSFSSNCRMKPGSRFMRWYPC